MKWQWTALIACLGIAVYFITEKSSVHKKVKAVSFSDSSYNNQQSSKTESNLIIEAKQKILDDEVEESQVINHNKAEKVPGTLIATLRHDNAIEAVVLDSSISVLKRWAKLRKYRRLKPDAAAALVDRLKVDDPIYRMYHSETKVMP